MRLKIDKNVPLIAMMKQIHFSEAEKEAIKVYQSPGNDGKSGEINDVLYNNGYNSCSPIIKKYIDDLTNACDKGFLSHDIDVLRSEMWDYYGIGIRQKGLETDQGFEGKIFHKAGFISTSLTKPFSRPFIYKITVPKGTHAIYLRDIADNTLSGAFEDELLIQRGYSLKIDKIERDEDGYPIVHSHLIINLKAGDDMLNNKKAAPVRELAYLI